MNAWIGTKVCTAVEIFIKCCKTISVLWKTAVNDWIKSSVECLQILNKTLEISLSAGTPHFHQLHVTFLRFTKKCHRKSVSRRSSVVAYLRAKYKAKHPCEPHKTRMDLNSGWLLEVDKLCALYVNIQKLTTDTFENWKDWTYCLLWKRTEISTTSSFSPSFGKTS